MSPGSLRNFIKRVEKKERQAPARLGPGAHLERHKDYKARAVARQAREGLVRRLELDAATKNPDEFYHAMENLRTRGGVRVERLPAAEAEANDAIPEINLRMAEKAERRRLAELRASLPALPARRTLFLTSGELAGGEGEGGGASGLEAPSLAARAPGERLLAAYATLAARRAAAAEGGGRGPGEDDSFSFETGDALGPGRAQDHAPKHPRRQSAGLSQEDTRQVYKQIEECETRLRKIRKELGRREAEALRRKGGSYYGQKREAGRDEDGNPVFQIVSRRRR